MGRVIHYVEDMMEFLMYQSGKRILTKREMHILLGLSVWMENDDNYINGRQPNGFR